jgi:hypothetical protein
MEPRLTLAALFLVLSTACATPNAVQLDTGEGAPREYRPPTSKKSVTLDADAFEEALTQLVLDAPFTLRPAQHGGLVRAASPGNDAGTRWQRLMRKSFRGICHEGQHGGDCLSLLDDVMGLSEWDKLGMALGLSLEPLRECISEAVADTLAPQLFYTVIATGLVTWVVLAANPEPVFTKAAAVVSALMLIYLGVDTFLEVVDASRELKRASDNATRPEELEQAGQRFAKRVGPKVARVFVLAVTVVVSHGMAGGAAWLASRLPRLPHFLEAVAVATSQLGVNAAQVAQVSAVSVVGRTVVISLPATAVAMTAWNGDKGGSPARRNGQEPEARTSGNESPARPLEARLRPGGRLIGEEGSSPQIRIVKGSLREARQLFEQLSAGGTLLPGTTYPGTLVRLPTGGTVGLRPVSTSGPPTIDVRIPGIGIREIKFIP